MLAEAVRKVNAISQKHPAVPGLPSAAANSQSHNARILTNTGTVWFGRALSMSVGLPLMEAANTGIAAVHWGNDATCLLSQTGPRLMSQLAAQTDETLQQDKWPLPKSAGAACVDLWAIAAFASCSVEGLHQAHM